jgi:hypothetical protein
MLHNRVWTFIALPFLVIGIWFMFSLCIRAVFTDLSLKSGGGYVLNYHGPEDWTDIVFGILPSICLIITAAMAVVHFLTRKRGFLIAAMAGILAAVVLILLAPTYVIEKIRFLAFIDYRFSFLFHLAPFHVKHVFIIWHLKLLGPLAISFIFCVIGLFRSFRESTVDESI